MSENKDITLNFTRVIVYPEAKVLIIQCPVCAWRYSYAVTERDRIIKCRYCGRHHSLSELRLLKFDVIEDTGLTLGDVVGQIAADTLKSISQLRTQYREGVMQ
jgi:hypothetical protein